MVDEIKKPEDQKPTPLEPPKDIEELLKELPKVASPKPPTPLNPTPPLAMPPVKPPTPSLPPPKPQMPPSPLKPSSPPTSQLPASASPQNDKFKSLVRTMGEDLEAAKKGMKPEPKPFEIKPPPGGPKIAPPPPPLKMPPTPQIKLGPAERTRPLELPRTGPPVPPPPGLAPKKFVLNPKALILILVVLIAAFAGVWWFMNREPEIAAPIPTFTPTPTPVFPGLFEILGDAYPLVISSTDNFAGTFNNSIKNVSPLSTGKFTAVSVVDENGARYPFSEVLQKLQISVPNGLSEDLDANEWFIVAFGQQETFDQNGLLTFSQTPKIKLGLIAKATDPISLRSVLNAWETTMTGDLKNFFGINLTKATSEIFLDNIYSGADIRYRNFPYADNSIDYAIVSLSRFNLDYFILTNSRESIYSAVDLLQTQ